MKDPEHIFIEDIIYCPSQIYYYFKDQEDRLWVAYIHQRSGPLSFDVIEVNKETGEWEWNFVEMADLKFSRVYDINNQPSEEAEEKEIIELELEVMWYLKQAFPRVNFPDRVERIKEINH